MINSKQITFITGIILCIAVIFTSIFMFEPSVLGIQSIEQNPEYATKLFGSDLVSIDIVVDSQAWKNMLDSAQEEQYIMCDVVINGTKFTSVGIRPKGNSSLSQVVSSDSDRYSFKLSFDEYVKGQTCFGLDKFVVNNIIQDTSYMKEYLSYQLMDYIGVKAPLNSYANITLNGEPWGLYLAVESLEESFALRNFGSDYGQLYSVKKTMGGGQGVIPNVVDNNQPKDANRDVGGGGFGRMNSSSGGDLVYSDDNSSSYSDILDNAAFKTTELDHAKVIKAIKALEKGDDIEKYFDVDEILRYFAAHNTVVNLDSYNSNMAQNYYIYEKDGKLQILPWDYNLAFGGFQSGTATTAVNFPIDTPVSGINISERPLLEKLLKNEEYLATYHKYLQEIVTGYFESGIFSETIDKVNNLIESYVKNDVTAFYKYEEYQIAISALKKFGELRANSISGQLSGTIPSTTDGQSANKNGLIDVGTLSLDTLGSMGGDKAGGLNGDNAGGLEGDFGGGKRPEGGAKPPNGAEGQFGERGQPNILNSQESDILSKNSIVIIVIYTVSISLGLVFVLMFRRKKSGL